MKKHFREIPIKQLRWRCNPKSLGMKTTNSVQASKDIIGQHRALTALDLGLKIQHGGFNVFVTGFSGTGRTTTIKRMLREFEQRKADLYDHCFVHNFKKSDEPIAIRLKAGEGKLLQEKMNDFVKELKKSVPALFESRRFQEERKRTMEHFQDRQRSVLKEFEKKVRLRGFEVVQVQSGESMHLDIVPLVDGMPVGFEEIETHIREGKITRDDVDKIWEERTQLESQLEVISREMRNIERRARETMDDLTEKFTLPLVTELVNEVKRRFDHPKIAAYLNDIQDSVVKNLDRFQQRDDLPQTNENTSAASSSDDFYEFKVNVVVDNSRTKGTPIIIEANPRFNKLFGTIEFEVDRNGTWHTDFSLIKGGSMLQADGGFLVVNAMDVLAEPGVWHTLKRTMRNNQLEIQTMETGLLGTSSALKPEPVDIQVKVIMVGDVDTYYYLYHLDDEFKKIFKVRADFDVEMPRNDTNIARYVSFLKMICDEEELRPFDSGAVAEIIEEAVRLSGNQQKLSTRFNLIADIMKEADFWAAKDNTDIIKKNHVRKTIEEQTRRENLFDEKIKDSIREGSLLIDTEGSVIGQLNGLTIYDYAGRSFGFPTRITASTSIGKSGIVSIERETDMSGPSHTKGILILSGFIRSKFAQQYPLMLNASVAFEQSYGGVDGDSASSTEIYAILSSLSGIPIRQDYAVTGSMNQRGDIQPIGGVNEKIEGFFDVCKQRGLTGSQGVIIPQQNIKDLMLRPDVIAEIEKKNFRIFSILTVEEGIELLTGIPFGKQNEFGEFTKGTLGYLVDQKLRTFSIQGSKKI